MCTRPQTPILPVGRRAWNEAIASGRWPRRLYPKRDSRVLGRQCGYHRSASVAPRWRRTTLLAKSTCSHSILCNSPLRMPVLYATTASGTRCSGNSDLRRSNSSSSRKPWRAKASSFVMGNLGTHSRLTNAGAACAAVRSRDLPSRLAWLFSAQLLPPMHRSREGSRESHRLRKARRRQYYRSLLLA